MDTSKNKHLTDVYYAKYGKKKMMGHGRYGGFSQGPAWD